MVFRRMADFRLLTAGRVVGSTDGMVWLVHSSIRTKNGLHFKLADLAGNAVPTPPGFDPVPPRMARLASIIRLAYNVDFDLYVKEYISEAAKAGSFGEEFVNKPTQAIDPGMNWAKFFQKALAPYLGTTDSETQDEGVSYIINLVLLERKTLLQPRFQEIVDNFTAKNPKFPELPVAKQITIILMNNFGRRGQEGRRYVREVLQGQDVSEGVTGESFVGIEPETEEGTSPVETREHGVGEKDFYDVEQDVEMGDYLGGEKHIAFGRFSHGFKEWMLKKLPSPVVRQYMRLLTLLHQSFQSSSTGKRPKFEDFERQWAKAQNAHEPSRNRWSRDTFKRVWSVDLPLKIETYVRTNAAFRGEETALPDVIRILVSAGKEIRERQLEESGKDQDKRREESGKGRLPEPATASLKEASGKQWEVSRCACGEASDLKTCPACGIKFCASCYTDHSFNHPGHEKTGL